jgi:hypothetical protein
MVAAARQLPHSLPGRAPSTQGPMSTSASRPAGARWSAQLAAAIATRRPTDELAPPPARDGAASDSSGATDDLRRAVADLLAGLARRCEPALIAVLKRAARAWDQADAFSAIDGDAEAEVAVVRRRLAAAAMDGRQDGRQAQRAAALEGLLAVDTAVALVRVFERRLATLLRLRLRSATPDLLPGGRPFLDLAGALAELAEAWR